VTQETAESAAARSDVATTLKNALTLGGSLIVTLGIGFGVRIALRRYLGPAVIGPVNFADAFTTGAFVFLGLGVDNVVRKVVPVTLDGANEFLGTIFALRALLSIAVFAVMGVVLTWMGQPPEVRLLVWVYGVAQFFMAFNATFVSLLQSARTIDGLSRVNVLSKFVWAIGFIATMVFQWPLVGIPISVAVSEFLKLVVGYWLARKHTRLVLKIDWKVVRPLLRDAFPFYVNAIALVVVSRFDVNVLKMRASDAEIGLYSSASELAQMTFVLMPMLAGVVTPLFARAAARAASEYHAMLRRTLELVLTLAFPVSLAIAIGADFWVRIVLGHQYAAAAWALSILGPTFLLTYTATTIAIALNVTGGEWTVTVTSVMSMFINPLLVIFLTGFAKGWGEGGGGAACAMATVGTETFVLIAMFSRLGRIAMDARLAKMLVKTVAVCVAVAAIDRLLLQPLGGARLLLDGLLYVGLVLGTGAVSVKETAAFVKQIRAERAA
jgi:O-antigen/teichoic acid export membrane protein